MIGMTQDAHESPELDLSSLLDLSKLPDDPSVLKQLLAQLILLVRKETQRREEVERAIDTLLRQLQRNKTLPDCPGQGRLFEEASAEEPTPATSPDELDAALAGLLPGVEPEPARRRARPHGRRRPAKDLETIDVVHDIAEEVKALFAEGQLQPLPDVITYQYDYRPGRVLLVRHIQRKYLRRDVGDSNNRNRNSENAPAPETCALAAEPTPANNLQAQASGDGAERIPQAAATATVDATTEAGTAATADATERSSEAHVRDNTQTSPACPSLEQRKRELPPILLGEKRMVLPSCLAAAGLLAFVWLSKFGDHLPLYRQETITRRFGIHLARSTLCRWMIDLAEALKELYQLMIAEVLRSRVLHTDDTTVQRQDVETGKWSTRASGTTWETKPSR